MTLGGLNALSRVLWLAPCIAVNLNNNSQNRSISLLISGFVIPNMTIMVISRRAKEIGMLMVMGATGHRGPKIFLSENMLQSPPAGVLGCVLGFAFAKLITLYHMDVTSSAGGATQMITIVRPEYFFCAVLFVAALNFISGICPAYVAAGLDPVEAIESE